MLLTLSTTLRPATDLGFLLHKHPDRVQSFRQAVGTAHVFYPEADDERCTAALLLEVDHEQAAECRKAIAPFAELERSPEHIHTYRLTPLGLWNAMAAGHDAEQVVDVLMRYSRYPVASSLLIDVTDTMSRYGRLRIEKHPTHGLVLLSTDKAVLTEVLRSKQVRGLVGEQIDDLDAFDANDFARALVGL